MSQKIRRWRQCAWITRGGADIIWHLFGTSDQLQPVTRLLGSTAWSTAIPVSRLESMKDFEESTFSRLDSKEKYSRVLVLKSTNMFPALLQITDLRRISSAICHIASRISNPFSNLESKLIETILEIPIRAPLYNYWDEPSRPGTIIKIEIARALQLLRWAIGAKFSKFTKRFQNNLPTPSSQRSRTINASVLLHSLQYR